MPLEPSEGWYAASNKYAGVGREEETKQDGQQIGPLSPSSVIISRGTSLEVKSGKCGQGEGDGLDLRPCPLEEGLIDAEGETPQCRGVKPFVYVIAWTAAISGLLFGYDVGGSGGTFVMDSFRGYFGWPPMESGGEELAWVASEQGWITGSATLGCLLGSLPSGALADCMGRRKSILLLALVFTAGALIQLLAGSMVMLYVGRVVAGVGMGGLSMVAPLYQAETAPPQVRGLVVCLQQLSLTLGILLAGGLNVLLQGWSYGWRVSYGGQCVFSLLLLTLMTAMPESPRWLVAQGRWEEARVAMLCIRHEDDVDRELQQVSRCVAEEAALLKGASWRELWSKEEHMRYRTVLGISIQLLQQACGINAVMFFFPVIARSFLSSGDAILANLGVDVCFVLATFVAIYLADRAGRKVLLMCGALGMSVFLAALATLTTLDYKHQHSVAIAMTLCTCMYVVNFAYSWGPLAWLVPAEIYPQRLRGKGLTLTTAASWLTTFAVAKAVPTLISNTHGLGLSRTFILFACCGVVMAVAVYVFLPETKGVALEDMDALFHTWRQHRPHNKHTQTGEGAE